MLELKSVEKTVGIETHIHPTDLTLEPGSFNILLGTTLAGKTTLMQLMAGLERPTSGEVWFNGKNVTGVAVQKRNVSIVYQQFINYPNMTVYENIASPLRVARMSGQEIEKRVGGLAEMLRISSMLDRRPSELSGGQQQRCAIARALAKESEMILLDEPLANLDFKLREELRDELPRIFQERDCVVVYATTEPTEALLFGGKTAAMHHGRVIDFGPTGQAYRQPVNLLAAKVFSEPPINTASITKKGARFVLNDKVHWPVPDRLKSLRDGAYTMGIRPHHVSPLKVGETPVAVEGIVHIAELSGSESMIHFDAYGDSWVSLSHGVHPFDAGAKATLYADVSRCLYFDEDERLVAVSEQREAV
ncbi:MAG: ABC transporter ATP-binding protein [Alphaproteobacteria bacterium]|nr:ABC transporter ATP-binding protein [Alphaproteobacteria bacterium]